MTIRPISVLALLAMCLMSAAGARAELRTDSPWPEGAAIAGIAGAGVQFPTISPFSPAEMTGDAPADSAVGRLYMPEGAGAGRPAPAVILLHGASGVRSAREDTYARQFAAQGVAALVVDVFGARRDRASGFIDRLLEITESMMVADAYAALRFLAGRPGIDADRIALVGFSYGGMASMYALSEPIAGRLAPDGVRFAAHVAFYGPCIARFEDTETTGAPILMLWGDGDELIDADRCAEVADDMRDGGSEVRTVVYPGALHQWDGGSGRRPIGRLLTPCRLRVGADGRVRDEFTRLPMTGPITRRIILAACVENRPYMIGADDAVRALSNRDMARFLNPVLTGR